MSKSNAFERMMSASGGDKDNDVPLSAPSLGGRPLLEHWNGYGKIYVNGRIAAKCRSCMKTLANTAKVRIMKHR